MDGIESREFRRLARKNCYRYGSLYVYSSEYIDLDKHEFPSYSSKEGAGAVEKFLTLVQSLGSQATGNDSQDKLSKPLPGVQWSGDSLSLDFNLSGTMYFTDYKDYIVCKNAIRNEFVKQGWEQVVSRNEKLGWSLSSYRPSNHGSGALYNDDPVDAAGMAMLTSAMQHTMDQAKILTGYFTSNEQLYAEGKARAESTAAGRNAGNPVLGGLTGIGGNIAAGITAMGANFNSGVLGRWVSAGHPIELIIDGGVATKSVNVVLTNASLKEEGYVVDDTSGNTVYPTQMSVSLSVKNMYGALLSTSSVKL